MPTSKQAHKRILVVEDDRALNHVLVRMLSAAGYAAEGVRDGLAAVRRTGRRKYDLMVLDIGLPKLSGIEVLKRLRVKRNPPRVLVMTADDTPETVLHAVRDQAYRYVAKPVAPKRVVEIVRDVLSTKSEMLPIEVVSSKPDWVELLIPCQIEAADRLQSFLDRLIANLPEDARESIAHAFRELLMNAIEWGGGFDPTRKVRIACIRSRRTILYRIQDPGPGFRPESLSHAAIGNDPDHPIDHLDVRMRKNLRPGGFGLLMTRAMVDELIYNEAHNEVVFLKYL